MELLAMMPASRKSTLPPFSTKILQNFLRRGIQEQQRIESESGREIEQTTMWTTPGMRPLAEAPIMDWDRILDEKFSEARLNALFAGSPENQCKAKDLQGEILALKTYWEWVRSMNEDEERFEPRPRFYTQLRFDIHAEWTTVQQEWEELWKKSTSLGAWEYHWLDKDGKTSRIQHQLRMGQDIFSGCTEARLKYAHLIPTGYEATPIGVFEYEWLDEDGGTSKIEEELKRGRYILTGRPKEVKRKYGYLQARRGGLVWEPEDSEPEKDEV